MDCNIISSTSKYVEFEEYSNLVYIKFGELGEACIHVEEYVFETNFIIVIPAIIGINTKALITNGNYTIVLPIKIYKYIVTAC